ncbi:MAG: VC0807 family protein [Streptosporangiaceae bacterium]
MTSNVQQQPIRNRSHLAPLAKIAVFDIAGPLITYSVMRNAGQGAVPALIFSGIFPAFGVVLGFARHRRVDAVGILVLAGVAVGTVLGLVSGSARLMLAEGSVPTAIFGLACIGSLWTSRPLIFRFALEFVGADTPKGRDFAARWRYAGFRRVFRLITVVWGAAYLAEAGVRVMIIEMAPVGTALLVSKVMPYAVAALLIVWTQAYGQWARRRGERLAAASRRAEPHRTPELQDVSA